MTIDEIMRSDAWFRFRPELEPDLSSGTALVEWIERLRWAAFAGGARGQQISEIEAAYLFLCLTASVAAARQGQDPQGLEAKPGRTAAASGDAQTHPDPSAHQNRRGL